MELLIFALALTFFAVAALNCGADTRPGERDHSRNW
jgi:hypothetical protein